MSAQRSLAADLARCRRSTGAKLALRSYQSWSRSPLGWAGPAKVRLVLIWLEAKPGPEFRKAASGLSPPTRPARHRPAGQPSYPLGSTTTVTSGDRPAKTLIATLYVPSDLSGSSRSILWR